MPNLVTIVLKFPYWWYYEVPRWFLKISNRVFTFLDRKFAVVLMLRLWFTPLFGDPNVVGRVIGFIFRSIRIITGSILIFLSELALLFYFLLWLATPFLLFSKIGLVSAFLLSSWFVIYLLQRRENATKEIGSDIKSGDRSRDFMSSKSKSLISTLSDTTVIFDTLLKDKSVTQLVLRLGFTIRSEFIAELGAKRDKLKFYPLSDMLNESLQIAHTLKAKFIEPHHLFLSLLKKCGYRFEEGCEIISWQGRNIAWHSVPMIWESSYAIEGLSGFNRSWTGRVTPNMNKFGVDLTREAQAGRLPILVGKKKPLAEIIRVLEKSSKNNVIIVGQPGCGKTSLVFGIAGEIISGTRSRALMDRRLFSLEIGKLIAGAATSGDLQERMVSIIKDIEDSGNIILFIDEIQNAVSAGGGVDTSLVFSALEPHLTGKRLQIIGATSWKNYRRYIEPNEAFARLFEIVEVPEANFSETLEVLELISFDLEKKYRVLISFPALKSSVELSAKYIFDRVLPDKAVDLLEETVAEVSKNSRGGIVLSSNVESLISEKTNIPVTKVTQGESQSLLNLENKMHERLIDQEEAVSAIANSIRRARVGLRDESRPIVSLLFVGPTGVGKTETAKTLAETFFGREGLMIRFDMSEYQNQDTVAALIDKLTDGVRRSPFSLVLFDEVEKAHPKILDIFLQVLEDGRLTDANGMTVSFSNSIIVFTSNAGTSTIFTKLREGLSINDFKKDLLKELEESFRIELLNRFDGVIIFKPLTPEHVEMITRLKLNKVAAEMEKNDIKLSFSEGLVKKLSIDGFDPALGARPLRRLIQDKIESTLAKKILKGELKRDELFVLDESLLED